MNSPNECTAEIWKRIVECDSCMLKADFIYTLNNGDFVVELYQVMGDSKMSLREIVEYVKSRKTAKDNNPGNRLELHDKEKFFKATIEEEDPASCGVFVLIESDVDTVLDDVYLQSPSSPPEPVTIGSLIAAPWEGNLYRAQEYINLCHSNS